MTVKFHKEKTTSRFVHCTQCVTLVYLLVVFSSCFYVRTYVRCCGSLRKKSSSSQPHGYLKTQLPVRIYTLGLYIALPCLLASCQQHSQCRPCFPALPPLLTQSLPPSLLTLQIQRGARILILRENSGVATIV